MKYTIVRAIESLAFLGISRRKVKVVALRREGIEIEAPVKDTLILADDVIVISGKPRRIERIKKFMLDGG
jgi:CPA2 family monovalent cation:H+ antiporter-2